MKEEGRLIDLYEEGGGNWKVENVGCSVHKSNLPGISLDNASILCTALGVNRVGFVYIEVVIKF